MMSVIYKYELFPDALGDIEVRLPVGGQILSVGVQGTGIDEGIYIWALVDPKADMVRHRFLIACTGQELDVHVCTTFVGTVFLSNFVLHIFDLGEYDE
jgi:hypothetical protein